MILFYFSTLLFGVRSKIVAKYVKDGHQHWLDEKKKRIKRLRIQQ